MAPMMTIIGNAALNPAINFIRMLNFMLSRKVRLSGWILPRYICSISSSCGLLLNPFGISRLMSLIVRLSVDGTLQLSKGVGSQIGWAHPTGDWAILDPSHKIPTNDA